MFKVVLVHKNYNLEKWEEVLNKNLILKKKKKDLVFRDYISLSGIAVGNTRTYVFVVVKTR